MLGVCLMKQKRKSGKVDEYWRMKCNNGSGKTNNFFT